MTGTGYRNEAQGFAQAHAWSTVGGVDTAELNGSAGADQFWAYPDYSYLSGSTGGKSYYYRANAFEKTTGYSQGGAGDTARLYGHVDSTQAVKDTFVAGPIQLPGGAVSTRALMSDGVYAGSDMSNATFIDGSFTFLAEAYGFRTVFGESRDASEQVKNDVARMYDNASAADTFTGSLATGNATMTGSGGYTITARKFGTNVAQGDGVNDTALLKDSAFADWFEIDGSRARLFNKVNLNTAFEVSDFANLRAQLSTPSNTTQPRNKKKTTNSPPVGWTVAFDPNASLWAEDPTPGSDPWWNEPWTP
jgi:hypothetical protein